MKKMYNLLLLKSINGISNPTLLKILKAEYNFIKNESINYPYILDLKRRYNLKYIYLSKGNFIDKLKFIDNQLDYCLKNKIKNISIYSKDYPTQLKMIYNPPAVIFYKGNIHFNYEKSISIVGSRKATIEGKKNCETFIKELSTYDMTVVSGMASGIDKYAHEYSLNNKLKCIGVVGNGVNYVYPATNANLYADVIGKGGAILSEYFPMETPQKQNFPQRNRIIAGLSKSTLVVEAAKRSGASITANYAFEEGRLVYALPGSINREYSVGCNNLIKNNIAKLVTCAEDIVNDYSFNIP